MDDDSSRDKLERLSTQQIRLLKLVAGGVTASKQLARATGLQPGSIDTYLHAAARTLGADGRNDAARRLLQLESESSQSTSQLRSEEFPERPESLNASRAIAIRRFFGGLPFGGERHNFSWVRVGLEIIRVGLLGMVGLFALVLFILGFLRTFK